jgi:hypothetical protein
VLVALAVLAAAAPLARAADGPVLVVGDSLAVGMRPFLIPLLGDREVAWNARNGRTTPQGMQVLRAMLPTVTPETVVISLGTNDGPDPARFADRIRRLLGMLPRRRAWCGRRSSGRRARARTTASIACCAARLAAIRAFTSRAGTTPSCAARWCCPTRCTQPVRLPPSAAGWSSGPSTSDGGG